MKKISRFLIVCIFILAQFSSIAFAGNWPNMRTGSSSRSSSTTGSGGDFGISCQDTKTLYTVEQLEGGDMQTFTYEDSKGICGNTAQWFDAKWKNRKLVKYTGVKNPKITVGENLFKALLATNGLKPSDVIKEGKSKFKITAEIMIGYNSRTEYYTYRQAYAKGWINKRKIFRKFVGYSFRRIRNKQCYGY
jgi:hypothetical protein